ncbi:MAG: hypothetical protein JWQ97_3373 [Phenylobacterium sp.]|nr:hypothetical protein [Phenylobacterium sp.]
MPLAQYRRVAILSPTGVTGGPEAIHQFAQALNRLGVDCHIAYFGPTNVVELKPGRLRCPTPEHRPTMDFYSAYHPQVTDEIALDAETLVVLPETFATTHPRLQACGVAVWWLSVDNALDRQPELREAKGRADLFGRADLIHLYQSVYAREWLRQNGGERLYDLGDYTNEMFLDSVAKSPSPQPTASYNMRKGADDAQRFFSENPTFDGLGLRDFTKPQLRKIFSERLIYVDFGRLPGKDRLPREAALCGSVVFVHRQGAGAVYDDFPVPDFFKFDLADIESGELRRRLDRVVAEPVAYWRQQDYFRSIVGWEKAQFYDQVMRLWGVGRML